jgi:hypothetical protein
MIKLLNINMNNYEIPVGIATNNGGIIKEEAKNGEIFLLWEEKFSGDRVFLSVIDGISEDGFNAEQFRIIDGSTSHQRGDMKFSNMNSQSFYVYVLNKDEAEPYLKSILIDNLMKSEHKMENDRIIINR